MFQPVTHVLFDMDGLILNTEELYTLGFEKIATKYGKKFTFELKCQIMGQQTRELAASIIHALDLPLTVKQFLEEARAIFSELFPNCKIMPGVEKLITHLHNNKIPLGLATSSSKDSYDMKTQNHQALFDLFPFKTWGSSDPQVKLGKPHPDIFLVAANKFPDKPKAEKLNCTCLVFEDSPNGVRAGREAGMQVVMVPDPRLERALAANADATLVLNSMEDFQPELFGLPAFTD